MHVTIPILKPTMVEEGDLMTEQTAVIKVVFQGHSIFFTGNAGTGKSFLINLMIGKLPKETTYGTSSTGISSVQFGGLTIHSFSGIGHAGAHDDVWA